MSERPGADLIVVGASELVTCAGPAPAAGDDQRRVSVVPGGAVAARRGEIVWVGPEEELAAAVEISPGVSRIDVDGRAVLPGLVDPHTHLVWAGDRADEFEQRLSGASYAEIAAAGGGILRTVEATRGASRDELTGLAGARMDRLASGGVTSIEVKSGYGLSLDGEVKILEAAQAAARSRPYEVVTTFLGAHTFPREARGSERDRRRYVDELCTDMIPRVAESGLARFVDVFVDEHAFHRTEAKRVLVCAREVGLGVKVHADQLADDGAAGLAAELGAVSADHLEHSSEAGLDALAAAGTIAVLIPGASLFLKMDGFASASRMIRRGVPIALATDFNPGTCPCASMPLVMQLGCLKCDLDIDQAIVAATLNAAAAIGLADRAGSIEPGKRCDLLVLDSADRRHLIYELGAPRLHLVICDGRIVA